MADSSNYALHRPELLSALERGEAKLKALMAEDVLRLEPNAVLIEAGEDHAFVYRMRDGWAGRVRTLEDGRSQFILVFLPGDFFAVKSMFVLAHPDAVQTLSAAAIERVHYKKMREAYESDPDIALRCTWQVVEEERRLHNWVVSLGRGSAEERLAQLLSEFRGRLVRSCSISPDAQSFVLPMTQEQLADHIGVSPVHLNRVLKTLRDDGILALRGKQLTILRPEALGRIAWPLLDTHDREDAAFSGKGDHDAD